jgi:alcohol dehydrogenase class IV
MAEITFLGPRIIEIGGGAVARAPALLARLGFSRPLIVSDPLMVSSGLIERLLAPLREAGIDNAVFSDTIPELAGARLVQGLDELNVELSVPTPAKYGISAAAWHGKKDLMADQALASGSPANNPRIPDKAEIIALYETMYA